MRRLKFAGPGVLALVLVSACGGAATSPTTATRPSSVATLAATAPAAATTAPAGPTTPPVAATLPPAGGTTTPAGTTDLCALLTPADLKTATGKTYLAGTLDAYGQCNWNTDATGVNSGDLVLAAIQQEPLDYVKGSYGSGGVDATVGGHAAFYNPTMGLNSMWVDLGGGNVFVLAFPRSSDLPADYKAIAQSLAEIAVGRM